MGLDITLYRLKHEKNKESDFEYILDDHEVERFKDTPIEKYIKNKENQYYDFDKTPYGDDRYQLNMQSFQDGDVLFQFLDTGHELYPLCQNMMTSGSEKAYVITDEDVKLAKKYDIKLVAGEEIDYNRNLYDKVHVIVKGSDLPLRTDIDQIFIGDEIGYQRKGLNGDFYSEFTKDDITVVKRDRLEYIYQNYCNDKEVQEHFKAVILDQFVEGEMFVFFSW